MTCPLCVTKLTNKFVMISVCKTFGIILINLDVADQTSLEFT